ncbi:hypothetical protein AMATHDRAFT_10063 [Amanita thiersii Skay4041]|uniref:Uncharacterized protein n=1 Tax=Amanita thiersii Skay4041 TaxID=703135 RepID=A0A2A9NA16_9AGAR|nr:hypothetical protein AMATHDRAFT_10063 [Amanita thiersii Skay4041]
MAPPESGVPLRGSESFFNYPDLDGASGNVAELESRGIVAYSSPLSVSHSRIHESQMAQASGLSGFAHQQYQSNNIVSDPGCNVHGARQNLMNQIPQTATVSGFFHHAKDIMIQHGIFTEIHGNQSITNIYPAREQQPSSPIDSTPKHLSSLFTGREEYLEKLRSHFNNPSVSTKRRLYLLYGLGGIGKTQICLKFKEELEDEIPYIFWIDASSKDTITSSLKTIAKDILLITVAGYSSSQVLQVISKMKEVWFMIYDNADGPPSLVQRYLPQGNKGNIIITSRDRTLMRLTSNCGIEVVQMKDHEAGLLLFKAGGFEEGYMDKEDCKKIVMKLGCIPLAVDMAGAYMQATQCSPAQYLDLYSKECNRLLSDPIYTEMSDYGYSTYGTWEISMQKIQSKAMDEHHTGAQSAIKILNIIAFLHYLNLPLDMFKRAAVNYKENNVEGGLNSVLEPGLFHLDSSGSWDQYLFNNGIQELLSFSLIQKGATHNILSMHPLVHQWVRHRLQETDVKQKHQEARLILCSSVVMDYLVDDYAYWLALVPHVKANDEYGRDYEIESSQIDELWIIGFVFERAGFYVEAEEQLIKLIEACSLEYGYDHPVALTAMHNLASIYQSQDRWDESEKLLNAVLKARKLILGHDHPTTLTTMHNLASTYC